MLLPQRKFNHNTAPSPSTIVDQNSQELLNPNIYGNANSFNIPIYNKKGELKEFNLSVRL